MNEELATIEEAFDTIPAEVQAYIYSDEFDRSLSSLFKQTMVSSDKQLGLKGAIFTYIAQAEDREYLNEAINQSTTNEPDRQKIREWIDAHVTQKILLLITKAYAEDEDGETPTEQPVVTPAPAVTSLTALADRLKKTSSSVPSTRSYPAQKGVVPENLPTAEPEVTPVAPAEIPATQTQPDELAAPATPETTPPPAPAQAKTAPTPTGDPYHEPIE